MLFKKFLITNIFGIDFIAHFKINDIKLKFDAISNYLFNNYHSLKGKIFLLAEVVLFLRILIFYTKYPAVTFFF